MKTSIFIYGPPGCGKTRNAEKLMKAYGMHHVIDDAKSGDNFPLFDHVILTNDPNVLGAIPFYDAMIKAR